MYGSAALLQVIGVSQASLSKWSSPQIDSALTAASGLVDVYMARAGYTVPLVSPGGAVGRWTCIVAAYDLMVARGYQAQLDGDVELRRRYEETIAELKDLDGSEVLDLAPSTAPAGVSSPPVVVSNVLRGWTDEEAQ